MAGANWLAALMLCAGWKQPDLFRLPEDRINEAFPISAKLSQPVNAC